MTTTSTTPPNNTHIATLLYLAIASALSCIPALAGFYAQWRGYRWLGFFCYGLTGLSFVLFLILLVGFKLLRRGTPFLLGFLDRLNHVLAPIVSRIARTSFVGPVIGMVVRANFFVWFLVLLMSDQLVRALLTRIVGPHSSQSKYSIVNSVDPQFALIDNSLDKLFGVSHSYSVAKAYTLAVASKLAYEEVSIIKHELEKDGFDVANSFLPLAYKNICAYIVERENDIFLIFRGTSPLNIQNFVTDFNIGMMDVRTPSGVSMGKVHRGFWEAMGESCPAPAQRSTTLQVQLSSASLYRTITSTVQAAAEIGKFAIDQLLHHVSDPIDNSWIGYDIDIRHHSMYAQAEGWIMELINRQQESISKKRFYVGGHSLGGALGTIFVAKMIQSESPLLRHFAGMYTFGQPKVGDAEFSRAFYPEISCKIFHHAYNNDIVARVPPWFYNYQTPPGTLVFIDSAHQMTLYPPDPRTNEPVPVRPISYIHLSGLLNSNVIRRLAHESWLRVLFRLLFPFFLNDHFPSDYCAGIRQGLLNKDVPIAGQESWDKRNLDEEGAVGTTVVPMGITKTTRRHYAS